MLVLHGFTGNPQSVRPLADALVAQGFSVEMPLLSGHGTTVEDMMTTDWLDWSADAETALSRLAERTETQVVAGLSMGGSLTVWLATRHPEARRNHLHQPRHTGSGRGSGLHSGADRSRR
ncbi:MAG: alpha/beta fold hydrolase [Microthrixaceae bacterium]